jgi:hypothetical protein
MKLTETLKETILTYCSESDVKGMDISEVTEEVLDFLIDESHVDLSDDEDGDMYESLNNEVWDFIEENVEL